MNDEEILALFKKWNEALQTGVSTKVSALYEHDATLLPTIANEICQNHQEMEEYFDNFLSLEPVSTIDESTIRIFDSVATHSGVYTFTFKNDDPIQARFTFIYRWNGKHWKIITHHSSQMPI